MTKSVLLGIDILYVLIFLYRNKNRRNSPKERVHSLKIMRLTYNLDTKVLWTTVLILMSCFRPEMVWHRFGWRVLQSQTLGWWRSWFHLPACLASVMPRHLSCRTYKTYQHLVENVDMRISCTVIYGKWVAWVWCSSKSAGINPRFPTIWLLLLFVVVCCTP